MSKAIKSYEEYKNAENMIIEHFTKKGLKKLGRGGEAIVFGNKTDVFRVVMPQIRKYEFSGEDKRMYEDKAKQANYVTTKWHKYIKDNSRNPHLPKFTAAAPVNIKGYTFNVTKIERLKRINVDTDPQWIVLDNMLTSLDRASSATNGLKNVFERTFKTYYMKPAEAKKPIDITNSGLKKFFPGKTHITLKDFETKYSSLYATLLDLYKIANRDSRLQEDLTDPMTSWQNIMIRTSDNNFVITDPWMSEEDDY